jgi:hypothetical protein
LQGVIAEEPIAEGFLFDSSDSVHFIVVAAFVSIFGTINNLIATTGKNSYERKPKP